MQEQKRVQDMRLAEEYNKSLYFNRKLGDTLDGGLPKGETIHDRDFFRAYNPNPENGSTAPLTPPPNPTSYAGQASSTLLTPEIISEVNRILGQGYRLAIETVDERRFRTGSWNCYGSYEGDGAIAIAALETCLTEVPNQYVRLVGISSRDRRRMVETIIYRPTSKAVGV